MKIFAALLAVLALSACRLDGGDIEMTPEEMGAAVVACKRNGLGATEVYGMKVTRAVVVAIRCQVPSAAK